MQNRENIYNRFETIKSLIVMSVDLCLKVKSHQIGTCRERTQNPKFTCPSLLILFWGYMQVNLIQKKMKAQNLYGNNYIGY